VELTLDVAVQDTFLPGWAYDPFRHYEANILCRDADGGRVTHTLHLPQAYCVGYDEHFLAGDTGGGSFQCQLTLVAPDGWRVIPGAPGKFVAPAPREHGTPQTALLGAPLLTPTAPAVAQVVEAVVGATVATVLLPVALTLAFILGSSTPANAPGLPHPHLPPVDPNVLRLNTLAARHAAGSLSKDEEAELIALLAKVKGIHIQRLADLHVQAPLRGNAVTLLGFHNVALTYTKRPEADLTTLRNKFNSSVRKNFLKHIGTDPHTVAQLRQAGLSDEDIEDLADGFQPVDYQVHHKVPLDDGGDNSFDNLVLIKNEPFHKALTNLQNASTRGMQAGQTRLIRWPVCPGIVYPPIK
jgi:hypothetical protein